MNAPVFVRGVLVALALSLLGGSLFALLAPLIGTPTALRGVVLLVVAGCLIETLSRGRHAGRVLAGTGTVLLAAALVIANPPLWLWCALPVAALWLLRCLLPGCRPVPALLDAGVTLLGLVAAVATARHTGSVGLALWSLLLLQALAGSLSAAAPASPTDRFTAARRSAEAALQDLLVPRPSSRKSS